MSDIREVPAVLRKVGAIGFFGRVWKEVDRDNVFTYAAAMAYSWLFAIFPFFIFLLTLIPLLPERLKTNAETRIGEWVVTALPAQAQVTFMDAVTGILKNAQPGLLSVGALAALWAASGGMSATMSALDEAYDVPAPRGFLRKRFTAIALTLIVATIVILVTVLIPIGAVATTIAHGLLIEAGLEEYLPLLTVFQLLRYLIALLLMFGVLAAVYHIAPNTRRKFRMITPGSIFCVVVWVLLAVVFNTYVSRFAHFDKTYGALGGVVILLMLFYLNAVVLLLGAEINSEIDRVMGRDPNAS